MSGVYPAEMLLRLGESPYFYGVAQEVAVRPSPQGRVENLGLPPHQLHTQEEA
jgi:hypothetical protein